MGRALICASFSNPILSFKPSFKSGIPDKKHFMSIFPVTSHLSVVPETPKMRKAWLSLQWKGSKPYKFNYYKNLLFMGIMWYKNRLMVTDSWFLTQHSSKRYKLSTYDRKSETIRPALQCIKIGLQLSCIVHLCPIAHVHSASSITMKPEGLKD